MRPLSRELISQYDLNIKKYQYIRSSYYLETNKGKFNLRKVDVTKEQIGFCYEVDTHLVHAGFNKFCSIYPTKKNMPYAIVAGEYYIMQSYTYAEETDFQNAEDLEGIISVLAKFHKAAIHVQSNVRPIKEVRIKNIYEYYLKRQVENNKTRKSMMALSQKSEFEIMFLDECAFYRELEEKALASINNALALALIEDTELNLKVAHRDFTYHTVNKGVNNEYIINYLDSCNYDLQILDLSKILNKIMQKNNWNKKLLFNLITAYDKERCLSKEEMRMIKFLMVYPEKYNSICFKYITSRRRWNYSMFEQKWRHMMLYKEGQLEVSKEIEYW